MKKFVTLAFAVAIAASVVSAAPAKHKAVRMAGRTERAGKAPVCRRRKNSTA